MHSEDYALAHGDGHLWNAQAALLKKIDRLTRGREQVSTAIPELSLRRYESPRKPASYMLEQSLCLIAQGRKRVVLGEDEYFYDASHFLLSVRGPSGCGSDH